MKMLSKYYNALIRRYCTHYFNVGVFFITQLMHKNGTDLYILS